MRVRAQSIVKPSNSDLTPNPVADVKADGSPEGGGVKKVNRALFTDEEAEEEFEDWQRQVQMGCYEMFARASIIFWAPTPFTYLGQNVIPYQFWSRSRARRSECSQAHSIWYFLT